jgi:hypothetical protein
MCDLVEAGGLPCLVAQTLRFSGVVKEVRAWLPKIGALRKVHREQLHESYSFDVKRWQENASAGPIP